jgi:hypothetical protein
MGVSFVRIKKIKDRCNDTMRESRDRPFVCVNSDRTRTTKTRLDNTQKFQTSHDGRRRHRVRRRKREAKETRASDLRALVDADGRRTTDDGGFLRDILVWIFFHRV